MKGIKENLAKTNSEQEVGKERQKELLKEREYISLYSFFYFWHGSCRD